MLRTFESFCAAVNKLIDATLNFSRALISLTTHPAEIQYVFLLFTCIAITHFSQSQRPASPRSETLSILTRSAIVISIITMILSTNNSPCLILHSLMSFRSGLEKDYDMCEQSHTRIHCT